MLNKILQDVVNDVSGTLACGVVDLNTGLLLGVYHTVPYFTQNYLDAVAAATVDMFRGKNVQRVEDMISQLRGVPKESMIQEMFMTTVKTFHFIAKLPDKDAVVVLITTKETNQGMGWSNLRRALPMISAEVP